MTPEQLALLVDEPQSEPITRAKGPKGLLLALVRNGLDPGALTVAAALVLELDEGAGR